MDPPSKTMEDRLREARELMLALEASRLQFKEDEKARLAKTQSAPPPSSREERSRQIMEQTRRSMLEDARTGDVPVQARTLSTHDDDNQEIQHPYRRSPRSQQQRERGYCPRLPASPHSPQQPPHRSRMQVHSSASRPQPIDSPQRYDSTRRQPQAPENSRPQPSVRPNNVSMTPSTPPPTPPQLPPKVKRTNVAALDEAQTNPQPRQIMRRVTASSVESTDPSTSSSSEAREQPPASPKPPASPERSTASEASKLLLKMIKQEMVHSLMKFQDDSTPDSTERSGGDLEDSNNTGEDFAVNNNNAMNSNVGEVAEALLSSLATKLASDDKNAGTLHSGLMELMSGDDIDEGGTADAESVDLSELLLADPLLEDVDVSDPNNNSESNNSGPSDQSPEGDSSDHTDTSRALFGDLAVEKSGDECPQSRIDQLLKSYNNASHSNSDDDDDDEGEEYIVGDMSVVSDITGFTGMDGFNKSNTSPASGKTMRKVLIEDIPGIMIESPKSVMDGPKTPGKNRNVKFSVVAVRNFERILSDNPACSSGPPIGIGWAFKAAKPVAVDDWEKERKKKRRSGKNTTRLMLSRDERTRLVQKLGYTEKEIAAVIRKVIKTRTNRRNSVNNQSVQKVEEVVERVGRRFRKMMLLSKT